MINLTIPGIPVPKQRPRATTRGGKARMYTPDKTTEYEHSIKCLFKGEYPDFKPLNCALILEMEIYLPIPKTTSKRETWNMEDRTTPHIKKPDVDNIIKTVMDALNGLAYNDDSQITTILANKAYGIIPHVVVKIYDRKDNKTGIPML